MSADERKWLPSPCACFGGSCLTAFCPNQDRVYGVIRAEREGRAVAKRKDRQELDYADPRRAK
jgi:hypothetical protein